MKHQKKGFKHGVRLVTLSRAFLETTALYKRLTAAGHSTAVALAEVRYRVDLGGKLE